LELAPSACGNCADAWEWDETPVQIDPGVWKLARQYQQEHRTLEVTIESFNRGGLIAHWKGIECFIPASHLVDYPFPADPEAREQRFSAYVGQMLQLCVIEVEPARNRILLSQTQLEECERASDSWPNWLRMGEACEGVVTSVRPFGAFVDIGPLEGMIHISEISWGRVRHPRDFLQPGQTVRVIIINVDQDTQRVGLSLKRLVANPWDDVEQLLQCGDVMMGTVVSVERFGVFIELVNGLEGLLHVSEICGDNHEGNTAHWHTYKVGQQVRVCVLDIESHEHRIALGLSEPHEAQYAAL